MARSNSTKPTAMRSPHTAEELRDLIHYDPESGVFTWRRHSGVKESFNTRYAGTVAGSTKRASGSHGPKYTFISLQGQIYLAHRLAWLYVTGKWPNLDIDHINCDGADNRWANLREATRQQNSANTRIPANNKTGFKGVCFEAQTQRFRAGITVNRKHICLGRFDTAEDAHEAYKKAAERYFGSFARAS